MSVKSMTQEVEFYGMPLPLPFVGKLRMSGTSPAQRLGNAPHADLVSRAMVATSWPIATMARRTELEADFDHETKIFLY